MVDPDVLEARLTKLRDSLHLLRQMARIPFEQFRNDPIVSGSAPMGRLRNILIHEYLSVDLSKVYELLQHRLDDFTTFAQHVVKFLA